MPKKRIPKNIKNKINALIAEVEADGVPVSRVYLFGSHAKGTAHRWSDIDVCVMSPAFGKKIKDPMRYLWSKRVVLNDYTLEPIALHPRDFRIPSTLIEEIKTYGIRIK